VDILGDPPGFNYAFDYREVDGIIFPSKRRVYAHEADYQSENELPLVEIDMTKITLVYVAGASF